MLPPFVGQGKLVVTHLGKTLISRRTSTIVENLSVEHPAAKLVVMAANNMAQEVFSCFNFFL